MKLKFIGYIVLLIFATDAIAAGPVTHAYLAQKWISSNEKYNNQEESSFIRGTLFPDVRYLGVISRKDTHDMGLSLQDIKCDVSPFSKGKKLHSFVDEKREKFVVKSKIFDQLKNVPGQKYMGTFLKLLEDEVLYQKGTWAKTRAALRVVDDSEMAYKIKTEEMMKWHLVLSAAFYMPPSKYLANRVKNKKDLFNIPIEIAKKWSEILPALAEDPNIKIYVNDLIKYFDDVFAVNCGPQAKQS